MSTDLIDMMQTWINIKYNKPSSKTSPKGHPCSLGMPPIQRKNCLQSKGFTCLVKAPAGESKGQLNSSVSSIGIVLKLQSGTSLIHKQVWLVWSYARPGGHSYLKLD